MKNLYSENDKVEKRLKKTQQNGKIFHVHALEESTQLKCPYYRQNIDLMQSS